VANNIAELIPYQDNTASRPIQTEIIMDYKKNNIDTNREKGAGVTNRSNSYKKMQWKQKKTGAGVTKRNGALYILRNNFEMHSTTGGLVSCTNKLCRCWNKQGQPAGRTLHAELLQRNKNARHKANEL
jgi:hypothetical protein